MLRWNNDYNQSAHPAILSALERTKDESYSGYGLDDWCQKAAGTIQQQLGGVPADVHFLTGGTQANFTVIAAALRPYQGIISADTGHINAHETGAVENTGHKILALPGKDGKLTAEQIAREAQQYRESGTKEHIVQPKMVFLSYPTEYGTLYSKRELEEIRAVCREYGLCLYVDGARLGYGLGSEKSDVTLADLAALSDAFTIGGTKCGALFGEAVVLLREELKDNFRSYMKQNGAMLAKGWLLGLQFDTLLQEDLYFAITKQADEAAMRIKAAFEEKGIPFYVESFTNQQFVILSEEQMESLGKRHIFEYQMRIDASRHCVRFCTSWGTRPEDVETLIRDIRAL